MHNHPFKLILASKSPRRKEILTHAGFDFEIFLKEVNEDYPENMDVDKVAEFLAVKKANACKEAITEDKILLAADSIVILGNKIYGKPTDYEDAFRILTELSGNMHTVMTGVCLKSLNKQISFSGITEVQFDKLNREEIEYYITHYQPFDKAGAYGVQDWIGLCKIKSIIGTYTNVMGLPMNLVYKHLEEFKK